jgi:acyl-coenzyme A thioesterase PaaI-like protein
MVVRRSGDHIEARFQLGASVEGAPQRSHGGIVALALDDSMGFVLNLIHTVAYTGELTIRYKSATPLHRPLVIKSWLGKREGRKLWLEAELREDFVGAPIIATATGLFISIEAY